MAQLSLLRKNKPYTLRDTPTHKHTNAQVHRDAKAKVCVLVEKAVCYTEVTVILKNVY